MGAQSFWSIKEKREKLGNVPQPARDTPASASPVKKKRETYFKQASFSNFRPQKEVFNFF